MQAVNLRREQNIDVVRLAAELALRENQRLVELSTRLRKENLRLRGLDPAQLQQELALLDRQLEREANKLNEDFEKAKAAAEQEKTKTKPVSGSLNPSVSDRPGRGIGQIPAWSRT